MSKLDAYKMDGLGNDFIIFDKRKESHFANERPDHKNFGVEIILDAIKLFLSTQIKVTMLTLTFYNPDGGETSKACGNGSRCAAYLLMKENNTKKISLKTKAGILLC